jgi:hypothetical protein
MNLHWRRSGNFVQIWGAALALGLLAVLGAMAFQSVIAGAKAHEEASASFRKLTAIWRIRAASAELRAHALARATDAGASQGLDSAATSGRAALDELKALTGTDATTLPMLAQLDSAFHAQLDVTAMSRPDQSLLTQAWLRMDRSIDRVHAQVRDGMARDLARYEDASLRAIWQVGALGLALSGLLFAGGAVVLRRLQQERSTSAELIGQRQRLESDLARLRTLSETDPLTSLPNRRALLERLTIEIGSAQRAGMPLSVLMIDVDGSSGTTTSSDTPRAMWRCARSPWPCARSSGRTTSSRGTAATSSWWCSQAATLAWRGASRRASSGACAPPWAPRRA